MKQKPKELELGKKIRKLFNLFVLVCAFMTNSWFIFLGTLLMVNLDKYDKRGF